MCSPKGIKISELPTWSGNSDGDLADHYATTAKMCYLVPDLSSHFTYIMYMTLRGNRPGQAAPPAASHDRGPQRTIADSGALAQGARLGCTMQQSGVGTPTECVHILYR